MGWWVDSWAGCDWLGGHRGIAVQRFLGTMAMNSSIFFSLTSLLTLIPCLPGAGHDRAAVP